MDSLRRSSKNLSSHYCNLHYCKFIELLHPRGTELLHPRGTELLHPRGTELLHPRGTELLHPRGTESLTSACNAMLVRQFINCSGNNYIMGSCRFHFMPTYIFEYTLLPSSVSLPSFKLCSSHTCMICTFSRAIQNRIFFHTRWKEFVVLGENNIVPITNSAADIIIKRSY